MELLQAFWGTFIHYWQELWLTLAAGFLLSGFFYKFISASFVEKHLGQKGLKTIFLSSCVGIILPVCCIGSLPIALTFRRKGASLGAVLAFLVATPATSITALFVTWKLLGMVFTVAIFLSATLMAIIMGIVANDVHLIKEKAVQSQSDCCLHELGGDKQEPFAVKCAEAVRYGFITLPKEIGVEVIIGVALASFIAVFTPFQEFIQNHLTGLVGYAFVLVGGLLTYVCSTASVPLADALIQNGLSNGQGLCYLLVGPITSYGTILVIKKDFGLNVLVLYLGIIAFSSLFFGVIFDLTVSM